MKMITGMNCLINLNINEIKKHITILELFIVLRQSIDGKPVNGSGQQSNSL